MSVYLNFGQTRMAWRCGLRALIVLAALCRSVASYRPTMVTKVRESRWGNSISELAFVGTGCSVVVLDMQQGIRNGSLASNIIATGESLCPPNVSSKSATGAISTMGVSLNGDVAVSAISSDGDRRLYALELVYEGRPTGQLFLTAISEELNGPIVRISDGFYDDDLGFEVFYAVTNHTVYCLRYRHGTIDVVASMRIDAELRDVSPFGSSSRIVISSTTGLLVVIKKGHSLILESAIKSPGNGNDGFVVTEDLVAFVAAGSDGLRVFDLEQKLMMMSKPLPENAGWAGGAAATRTDSNALSFTAVVAADAGIFGYQLKMNGASLPQLSLAWTMKLGAKDGGCGWNVVLGTRGKKVYVSDRDAGLFVIDIASTHPKIIGDLQMN